MEFSLVCSLETCSMTGGAQGSVSNDIEGGKGGQPVTRASNSMTGYENACSTRHWLRSKFHESLISACEILCFLLPVAGQVKNIAVLGMMKSKLRRIISSWAPTQLGV